VLSLPDKPWKRVRLSPIAERRYRLTFLAGVNDEAEFDDAVTDDLEACLGPDDEIVEPAWDSRSVVIVTPDRAAFVRKLAVRRMIVEREA